MDTIESLTTTLTALVEPKLLPIEAQLKVDLTLYNFGEAVRTLLHENGLHDGCSDYFASVMEANKAKQRADELSYRLYGTLVDIRNALCWNGQPPFDRDRYTPSELDAIERHLQSLPSFTDDVSVTSDAAA